MNGKPMMMALPSDLTIDWIGGNCPVQAEGTIAGKEFFFRARGNRWSFEVADGLSDDSAWVANWLYEEPYNIHEEFAAGWMTEEEARGFIHAAAICYISDLEKQEIHK